MRPKEQILNEVQKRDTAYESENGYNAHILRMILESLLDLRDEFARYNKKSDE